jgi:hypothetical protein
MPRIPLGPTTYLTTFTNLRSYVFLVNLSRALVRYDMTGRTFFACAALQAWI